jgi:hypothetical protein
MSGEGQSIAPTFVRELDDLAASHLAVWLAAVLPPGPALLWCCERHVAATLAHEGRRPVVLLEQREGAVAEALRLGVPGVRVVHAPASTEIDLTDLEMGGFTGVVVSCDRLPDDGGAVLSQLVALGTDDSVICLVADDGIDPSVVAALGRASIALEQVVAACSWIGPGSIPPGEELVARVRQVGDPAGRTPRRHLVVGGPGAGAGAPSVLLGDDQGLAAWQSGLMQMTETVVRLDHLVGDEHAQRIAALERSLADANERRGDAERTAAALAAHIELIHRSTSWRITQPLRSLRDLVAKG